MTSNVGGPDLKPFVQGFLVWCDEHDLNRQVNTRAHATNLLALHLRKDHADDDSSAHDEPAVVDLSAAARVVLDHHFDPSAVAVWAALTGLEHDDALAYARVVAGRPTTAVLPPF